MSAPISLAEMLGLGEEAAEEGADADDYRVASLRIFLLRLLVFRRRGRFDWFCGGGRRVISCNFWDVFDASLKY